MTDDLGKLNSELTDQVLILQTTLDHIGAYVYTKDLQGRYTYVNQKVCELFDCPLEEIIGNKDSKFFSIEESSDIRVNDKIVMQEGKTVEKEELNVIAKTGETRYYITVKKPLFDANGAIFGMLGVSTDITERRKMEITLEGDLQRLNHALSSTRQGWFDLYVPTGAVSIVGQYAEILGYSASEFHTNVQEWQQGLHPEDRSSVLSALNECLVTGKTMTMEYRRKAKDGSWIWLCSSGEVAEWDEQHKPIRVVGMHRDISSQKKAELRNKIHTSVMEQLVGNAPLPAILELIIKEVEQQNPSLMCSVLLVDKSGHHLVKGAAPSLPDFYNEAINGLEIKEGLGPCPTAAFTRKSVIIEDIQAHTAWPHYKKLAAKAKLGSCWSTPIIGSDEKLLGTFAIYQTETSVPTDNDLQLISFISQLVTIAIERSQAAEQLDLSSRVFSDTHEGIIITDANKRIIDVNPACCDITGYSRDELLGKDPSVLSSGKEGPDFYAHLWFEVNEHNHWQGELWNRKKNGELYAELLTISALLDENGKTINYLGVFSDITDSKHQQEKLNQIAHYDVLTGLPNRVLFTDRFYQAIAHSKRTERQLVVCFLDIDDFKPVNDNYGHEVGNKLLVEVAKRITACIRTDDTVSRQGGDEFSILLNDIESYSHCQNTLDHIQASLEQVYLIDGYPHVISASIGATIYPSDNEDIDTLIRHADNAMYQAKQSGKHRYHIFDSKYDQQIVQKHHQLDEIQQALINNEFSLFYQPKVNMLTGEVFGFEALIRWHHPTKGMIAPLDFLPILDATEVELHVGNWVINRALQQLNDWLEQGINLEVSINIASNHLQSSQFFLELDAALARHPAVDPKQLQLEILESSALSDLQTISTVIKTCQDSLGVNIALDDFGTGYSSLAHLRSLSANIIKIDQSFVRDMLDDPSDYTIIDGVIGLAESFDREVIAEGVETTEHGLMLLMTGCDKAQGYGIARPMPADKVIQWLADYVPNQTWLEYGNRLHTVKENKIKLFQLITEHWMAAFVFNIQASRQTVRSWPMVAGSRDHFSQWLKRVRKERVFEVETLNQLERAYHQFHVVAQDLHAHYQKGELEQARSGIILLQAAFDEMSQILPKNESATVH